MKYILLNRIADSIGQENLEKLLHDFPSGRIYLHKNYINREQRNQEILAAYDAGASREELAANHQQFNDAVHVLQSESKSRLNEVFGQLNENIRASVIADLGSDTIAELNLIKDMKLSEFEIRGYAEKYTGNAKALRILNGIAEKNGIPFVYTSHDDVLEQVNELKQKVIAFINGY